LVFLSANVSVFVFVASLLYCMLKDIHAETNNLKISRAFHSIRETGQIAGLIAFFSGYFVFKNESVKVKYGFDLHAGLSFAM
jgi:hypothetical protein